LAISGLVEPGQTLLLPRPGFPLYETLACAKGIKIQFYDLLPDRAWEVDLAHLESLVNEVGPNAVGAVLLNNPSNPCGNVFSREHLTDIAALCRRHTLPVIADEIYADMAFPGKAEFHAFADVSDDVPFIAVGGIAKQYMVPGWRCGKYYNISILEIIQFKFKYSIQS
jgi:tyrosine aminotransferase